MDKILQEYDKELLRLEELAEKAYGESRIASTTLQRHRSRMSMTWSIKGRQAYLDGELVEE